MESDPYCLIEGMIIAGVVTGATQGHIYVRSEYPHAIAALNQAIERARAAGWLGADVLGSGRAFELFVAKGAGAYVCGEETALLESLEGKRARRGARQAAAARAAGPARPAHRDQQRHHAGHRADHHLRARRPVLPRLRHGPLARHPAVPAGGQHPPGRPGRARVRRHAARAAVRVRRRHRQRPAGARRPGGRPARHLPAGQPVGHPARLRSLCRGRRGGRARRHRAARRHLQPRRARRIRDAVLRARVLRQVHPVPDRLDARRRDHRPDPRRRHLRAAGAPAARALRHHGWPARCARWAA